MKRVNFKDLKNADLFVDAIYETNDVANSGGEVLSKLMSVAVGGGFRKKNIESQKNAKNKLAYIVLESTNKHPDWIDKTDLESGIAQYYGDNRDPGRDLHDTDGNKILKDIFEMLQQGNRKDIPPIFYFEAEKGAAPKKGRNRRFIGLLVPGSNIIRDEEALVAIWRTKKGERYQNYKAIFTILNCATISRKWLNDLISGKGYSSKSAPKEWKKWVDKGVYTSLCVRDSVMNYRTRDEQMPITDIGRKNLKVIYDYFEKSFDFEMCAIKIAQLMDPNIREVEHTRNVRDGGRDAIGLYRIGNNCDGVYVEFALEAKRYSPKNGVGVREVSRLISRLRHRQFGILITTSYVAQQAYEEIKEDGHPVVIVSGGDILRILYDAGIKTKDEILKWLNGNFPKSNVNEEKDN